MLGGLLRRALGRLREELRRQGRLRAAVAPRGPPRCSLSEGCGAGAGAGSSFLFFFCLSLRFFTSKVGPSSSSAPNERSEGALVALLAWTLGVVLRAPPALSLSLPPSLPLGLALRFLNILSAQRTAAAPGNSVVLAVVYVRPRLAYASSAAGLTLEDH